MPTVWALHHWHVNAMRWAHVVHKTCGSSALRHMNVPRNDLVRRADTDGTWLRGVHAACVDVTARGMRYVQRVA